MVCQQGNAVRTNHVIVAQELWETPPSPLVGEGALKGRERGEMPSLRTQHDGVLWGQV
jgi:hypothetical protein